VIRRNMLQMAFVGLVLLVLGSIVSAQAANVSIPSVKFDELRNSITANTLKPKECSALTLSSIVICTGGNCDGTGANELLLGTSGDEKIRGRGGSDCILGGGGNDQLVGNVNSDVCIGGPGSDTFTTCETKYQ
jgi:hypothetical protein